jgi:hypothetical protein
VACAAGADKTHGHCANNLVAQRLDILDVLDVLDILDIAAKTETPGKPESPGRAGVA